MPISILLKMRGSEEQEFLSLLLRTERFGDWGGGLVITLWWVMCGFKTERGKIREKMSHKSFCLSLTLDVGLFVF